MGCLVFGLEFALVLFDLWACFTFVAGLWADLLCLFCFVLMWIRLIVLCYIRFSVGIDYTIIVFI